MNIVIFTDPSLHGGPPGLVMIIPAYNDIVRDKSLTDDQLLTAAITQVLTNRGLPLTYPYQVIDSSQVPVDRANRNLWKEKVGGIDAGIL